MVSLSTASELSCSIPLVPQSFVVTQVTLHNIHQFSTCQFPLLWVLTLPFPFTDSQGLFPLSTYINRKIMALFFPVLSFILVVIAAMQQTIEPARVLHLTYWQVLFNPCLPELIWHRHLRLRSVPRPLASRPQLHSVGAKGENTCSHVTGWSPWRRQRKT
jgi:hypothetical protein